MSPAGHDFWLSRIARSVFERGLRLAYGGRGIVRVVNGIPLHVLPEHRWYFPPQYDGPVAQYLRERVRPGDVCISVGANMGIYPLQFAHWSGPAGKVYAFEPNPRTADVLRRHVALNHVGDRIEVLERAIGGAPGEAVFHATGVDGMSRLGEPNPALAGRTIAVKVAVDSLDHFVASVGSRPGAVMMDIEGLEIVALRGVRALFAARPAVVIEMHPNAWGVAGTDRADLERLLAQYRLRVVPLSGQADPLAEYGHVALEPAGP